MQEGVPVPIPDQPMRDGEKRSIPPANYQNREYSLLLQRHETNSSITFVGNQRQLDALYEELTDPYAKETESLEEDTAWQNFHGALWTTGKAYKPERDRQNPQQYKLFIRSNFAPTEDFRRKVLKPMAAFNIIPENVVEAFK